MPSTEHSKPRLLVKMEISTRDYTTYTVLQLYVTFELETQPIMTKTHHDSIFMKWPGLSYLLWYQLRLNQTLTKAKIF